ncbi:retropepsin-like domain-containing protein [Aestuariivivens sediminis]|uniref:retropepsin-like domain-containing protein n=1 Tax=Aestuariivivens sediminis TaxID=2913557 RepID=UPI001F580BB2|nr:retropepsin-like domain-containing protein [Aestuariivivens sediminis]
MNRPLFHISLLCFCCSLSFSSNKNKFPIHLTEAEIINEHTTRIPFKIIDQLLIIEGQLLNKRGHFIIDTGSENMILNKVHFSNIYEHQKKKDKTSGVIHTIDNPYEKQIKEFFLNHFKLQDKTSDVIDLSHIENAKKIKLLGIIGYSILKDYEVFIDLYLNQITLTEIDPSGNKLSKMVYLEKITDSITFTLKRHTVVLNGRINDHKVALGLDTAAEFNQINKSINRNALKYFIPTKRLTLVGAGNKEIEVLAGKLHRVKLSNTIYFGPMDTVLTNLDQMNQAYGTHLDGVLGYEFFKQKRTIINYKKKKLYFIKHPTQRF